MVGESTWRRLTMRQVFLFALSPETSHVRSLERSTKEME